MIGRDRATRAEKGALNMLRGGKWVHRNPRESLKDSILDEGVLVEVATLSLVSAPEEQRALEDKGWRSHHVSNARTRLAPV
jgi:hypothetical protein